LDQGIKAFTYPVIGIRYKKRVWIFNYKPLKYLNGTLVITLHEEQSSLLVKCLGKITMIGIISKVKLQTSFRIIQLSQHHISLGEPEVSICFYTFSFGIKYNIPETDYRFTETLMLK